MKKKNKGMYRKIHMPKVSKEEAVILVWGVIVKEIKGQISRVNNVKG